MKKSLNFHLFFVFSFIPPHPPHIQHISFEQFSMLRKIKNSKMPTTIISTIPAQPSPQSSRVGSSNCQSVSENGLRVAKYHFNNRNFTICVKSPPTVHHSAQLNGQPLSVLWWDEICLSCVDFRVIFILIVHNKSLFNLLNCTHFDLFDE